MTTKSFSTVLGFALISMLVGFLITGCGTTKPAVDWNSRIGNYNLTQARADMGAPVDTKPTSSGGTVAEWRTLRAAGSPSNIGMATGPRAGGVDVAPSPVLGGQPEFEYLRLTFDANGTLTKWNKSIR